MKKVSKRVSSEHQAYSAHGAKAPSPGQAKLGETGPTQKVEPSKGKQIDQGSKKIDQASAETASMEVAGKVGSNGKGKDSRAASAESQSKLAVKGPNQGQSQGTSHHKGQGK